nr:hypothetical protein [Tanacetum cinerariifolium]
MNQFCEMKSNLRQFSVARNPQQNRVEAVNTTCYVQNRVLVVKPHNKTAYEPFRGKTPTLSFMRPFGCPVTILNTIDHLGKFNGRADEGFFVGYSLNSKAFRVFISRTRILEENLHIRFSESTTIVVDSGPDWLFDIDALTRTMNYEPISSHDDGSKPLSDDGKKVDEDPRNESEYKDQKRKIMLIALTMLIYWNKKDERGHMIRNKARLVAQGYTQEERIGYDEVFSLIVRIKAIRLFLAYASCKDFVVYQMDVKSTFLYGKIEEEVYVCQPPGFEDPNFPDIVYKELCIAFEKLMQGKFQMSSMGDLTLFLGLQVKQKKDGIFISQDKYVAKSLKKFRFTKVKTVSTSIETQKPLLKDEDGEEVDVHMYRYQVNPKVSHLHVVKRILRKPTRKDTQVPQPSGPTKSVVDEAVHKELGIGNILQSDEDSLKLNELMALCTNLQNRVLDLEKTTTTQRNEIDSLKTRVTKLEKKNRTRTHKLKRLYKVSLNARVESSSNEESLGEDASKQGRRINAIDANKDITLVSAADNEMFNVDVLSGEEVFVARQNENVVEKVVDAAQDSPAATTVTITTKEITLAQDKGKGIIIEEPLKWKDQIRLDEEADLKLQASFDEKERLARKKAKKVEEANIVMIETWDDIQAKINDDH